MTRLHDNPDKFINYASESEYGDWRRRVNLLDAVERFKRVSADSESVDSVYGNMARSLIGREGRPRTDTEQQEKYYNLCHGLMYDDEKLLARAYMIEQTGYGVPGLPWASDEEKQRKIFR